MRTKFTTPKNPTFAQLIAGEYDDPKQKDWMSVGEFCKAFEVEISQGDKMKAGVFLKAHPDFEMRDGAPNRFKRDDLKKFFDTKEDA